MENTKILIVGAGISGLAAAQRLLGKGFSNLKIIDARDRVGGRIYTQKYGLSHIEIGAQWIHGEGSNPVYQMAAQHNLLQVDDESPVDYTDDFYTQRGELISSDIIEETCDVLDDILEYANIFSREGKPLTCEDDSIGTYARRAFYEYLRTNDDNVSRAAIKEAIFNWKMMEERTENGCKSADELSLYSWGQYLEYDGNPDVVLKCGYESILKLMLDDIPSECIQLCSEVTSIEWQQQNTDCTAEQASQVHVSLATDVRHLADYVIYTGSLGVLKSQAHHLFSPALPDDKLGVITRMGFGTVNKIYLEYEQPFWKAECGSIQLAWLPEHFSLKCLDQQHLAKYGEWYRSIHGFDVVDHHDNLLCGWIPGHEAEIMELVEEKLVLDVCHEILTEFTGRRNLPRPIRIIRTRWNSDPYTRGSYSYIRAGNTAEDCALLSLPLPNIQNPRLLFAGEATSLNYFSTTHGALLSGQREADRLIDHIQSTKSTI